MLRIIKSSYIVKRAVQAPQQFFIIAISIALFVSIILHSYTTVKIFSSFNKNSEFINENRSVNANTTEEDITHYLFGIGSGSDDEQTTRKPPPQVRLPLVLRGVISNPSEKELVDSAIISSNNQEKLYFLGASVPGGATLKAVFSDHIELSYGGSRELLFFPEPENNDPTQYITENTRKNNFTRENSNRIHANTSKPSAMHEIKSIKQLREQLEQTSDALP